ncbi:type II toxin-antitoxin system Phd/YefM family antitoxin [Sphingomonas mollis]|uniref:Type II toxin-antitoxin system prevent-host-death family antitoxin n=1 Tax=Sphingomonas mollis TaxID=2795726 RepID=A0ABS0XR29_9SPHN|nr:hypothetical protein [Sphingomonas sp. BT553]MBJ6122502.1 hypothetical protein [Sphingomonas sp. BT553]
MDAYNLSDADGRLTELVDRVRQGESVDILQEGRIVARLTAAAPVAGDAVRQRRELLKKIRVVAEALPLDPIDTVADMRKQARY